MKTWQIIDGDCREALRALPAASAHVCVTSPPYFGLRDYGHDGQIGLEPTPDEFVAALVGVFREVQRVLRDDGTVWLNLGDSYCGYKGDNYMVRPEASNLQALSTVPKSHNVGTPHTAGVKNKDLIGIPWMVAFALRADGWYLRSEIIWHKPNPMPESVTDRPTKAHEQVFLLSKSPRYYYDGDAVREDASDVGIAREGRARVTAAHSPPGTQPNRRSTSDGDAEWLTSGRNKRSVWSIDEDEYAQFLHWRAEQVEQKPDVWPVATRSFAGAHFATFPPKLIEPCILAGCPERCCSVCGAPWERQTETEYRHHEKWFGEKQGARHSRGKAGTSYDEPIGTRTLGFEPSCAHSADPTPGTVLDPFAGAGTTGMVALRHGRSFVGCELNAEYAAMARDRIETDLRLGHRAPKKAAAIDGQGSIFDGMEAA